MVINEEQTSTESGVENQIGLVGISQKVTTLPGYPRGSRHPRFPGWCESPGLRYMVQQLPAPSLQGKHCPFNYLHDNFKFKIAIV
jgi:hypothetical protein